MMVLKVALFFLLVGSIGAATFRELSKRVLVGTVLSTVYINETHENKMTGEWFNLLTPEKEMKWGDVEAKRGHLDFSQADEIVAYGQKHNMTLRGHTLLWHNENPTWAKKITDKAELHNEMVKRITAMVTRYKGKLFAWDVVNEAVADNGTAFRENLWYRLLGEGYIAEAFHLAKKIDPTVKLYINENHDEGNSSKTVFLYNLIKKLKGQGVPIEGVGFQCHLHAGKVPANFEKVLEWFSTTLDVDVAVTELDLMIPEVNEKTLKQQADDYAAVFKACMNVKRCVSVSNWGWNDRYSWRKEGKPCMFDENFKPKPAVDAVLAVLK